MNIQINRPKPVIIDIEIITYSIKDDPDKTIKALLDRKLVLIKDFYSSGLSLLNELKKFIKKKHSDSSFQGQREYRSVFHDLSNKILLNISNNKLIVKKAPEIGWLKKLYPDIKDFLLPFPKVQGLNSSWQWYKKGIFIPVLEQRIYPYFGNYFPTRFDHLELFEEWLKGYKGGGKSAFDIGIGSGILSFQMLHHGFDKVIGTDINPNSIFGLAEAIKGKKKYSNLNLIYGNLFVNTDILTDLIVFNPPWLPVNSNIEGLDTAIYYNTNLFPDFFKEAKKRLKPKGKIVILFSNLAEITKVCKINPIEKEIKEGRRFKKDQLIKKEVKTSSNKTKRDQSWRSSEIVELWILSHK